MIGGRERVSYKDKEMDILVRTRGSIMMWQGKACQTSGKEREPWGSGPTRTHHYSQRPRIRRDAC